MCLLWNFYGKNPGTPRFVLMGGRGLGVDAPPADDWEEPDVRTARQKERTAGKGRTVTPFQLPEKTEEGPSSIDSGLPVVDASTGKFKKDLRERFPRIRDLIDELKKIEKREFWNKAPKNVVGTDAEQISAVVDQLLEAMLYQAIVENWNEATLKKQYERTIADFYTRAASRPFLYETGGQMMRAWHWAVTPENLGEGENKALTEGPEKREISPSDRGRIAIKLMVVEHKIKEEVIHPNWARDPKVNDNQLEFVEEEAIPLYRFWVIDEAIVHNISAQDNNNDGIPDAIYNRYVPVLRDLFTSTLKKD